MNDDTPAATPEPDGPPQSESAEVQPETEPETVPDPTPAVAAVASDPVVDPSPSTVTKLSITMLFMVLGVAGAWVGWIVQTDFVRKALPNAPSGMPGEGQVDSEFTLEFHGVELKGFEVLMAAMGVPAKHSTFNVLLNSNDIQSGPTGTSPDPQQVQAQMKREAERHQQGVSPRRNRVALYLMLLGIPLGAGIGLAEGIRRLSILHLLTGTIACAVLVGAAGFLGGGLHARVAETLAPNDLNEYIKLMIPQFVAWFVIGVGMVVWPLAMNPTLKTALSLGTTVVASALLSSLIYIPIGQAVFFDDSFELSVPGHVFSYGFWFFFGSGVLSMLVGHACASMGRPRPQPAE